MILVLFLGLGGSLGGSQGGSLFAGPSQQAALLEAGEPYPWMQDLDEARELAADQNKPLLLVFRCVP
jgi:hypothetical protein